ncbi:MAG: cysteine--tRNA ligase [Burkholderiales bacterium]|nr:cysteine--tRNA ligase [Burkholderiales bacterium]
MSTLKIYNTLTREKQTFVPLIPGKASMYVCGMTIYDYCHVGHARMAMAFDVVHRWLLASGYEVTYARNITDVDDKIIRRALENGETISGLTKRFSDMMDEDLTALGILPVQLQPRATEFIPQMLSMIATLEEKGLAYQSEDGDVNYAVRKFPGYGKLSRRSLDELRAGERIDINQSKNDPLDFVLWKAAKENEPDEAKWDSKWGKGRPGWHIECSAMTCAVLGERFDIHGGGLDLQFPHHENEIAQSEGALGHETVTYWMHNGFLVVDNEKMSKSLNNFFTIRDVLKSYDAEVLRFFLMRTHYRSPLNYSDFHLEDAKNALTRMYAALKETPPDDLGLDWNEENAVRFKEAMDDDFNASLAMTYVLEMVNQVNRDKSPRVAGQMKALAGVLGLLQRDPQAFLQGAPSASSLSNEQIEAQIAARLDAKKAKNFQEADRIRADLLAAGIVLEDKPSGQTEWRRA